MPTTTTRPAPYVGQRSHTILVAVDVVPTTDPQTAMALLTVGLQASPLLNPDAPDTIVESWHFAEDDRTDGNDSMSAVFCRTGCQAEAHEVLKAAGLA